MITGTINIFKARLVAQGNRQHQTIFFETFADHRSIHVLLSLAASESLIISSIDIKTTFLYSPARRVYIYAILLRSYHYASYR